MFIKIRLNYIYTIDFYGDENKNDSTDSPRPNNIQYHHLWQREVANPQV